MASASATQGSKDDGLSRVNKLPIDCHVNTSGEEQSPATNAASTPLVYVRRRVEVDTIKGIDSPETNQPKESTLSPAVVSSSPNPSLVSGVQSTPQEPSSRKLEWEERYHHLQMLLNKINESDERDHVQTLWSFSSTELSKHAVELEKRSIQLSLEEAREMQRVTALKVLERSVNSTKSTSNERD